MLSSSSLYITALPAINDGENEQTRHIAGSRTFTRIYGLVLQARFPMPQFPLLGPLLLETQSTTLL